MKSIPSDTFLFANDCRPITSVWQRAPYCRRYGREMVSKPAFFLEKSWEGYHRRMTQTVDPKSATPTVG